MHTHEVNMVSELIDRWVNRGGRVAYFIVILHETSKEGHLEGLVIQYPRTLMELPVAGRKEWTSHLVKPLAKFKRADLPRMNHASVLRNILSYAYSAGRDRQLFV